jgi:hypothetical protein
MLTPETDDRSAARKLRDEEIAALPKLPPPDLNPNAPALPLEIHLSRQRRPLAVAGIVENGVVRPIDPSIVLPEHARVIIVATE